MKFVNWDDRPAVLFENGALAKLSASADWKPVDFWDVSDTAGLMSEAAWRARFEARFGPLDPPTSMPPKASPMAAG